MKTHKTTFRKKKHTQNNITLNNKEKQRNYTKKTKAKFLPNM